MVAIYCVCMWSLLMNVILAWCGNHLIHVDTNTRAHTGGESGHFMLSCKDLIGNYAGHFRQYLLSPVCCECGYGRLREKVNEEKLHIPRAMGPGGGFWESVSYTQGDGHRRQVLGGCVTWAGQKLESHAAGDKSSALHGFTWKVSTARSCPPPPFLPAPPGKERFQPPENHVPLPS